jgi:hypothetical protein
LINPLPLRGRVGERGSERYNIEQTPLDYPLILAFSRSTQRTSIKEKGCIFLTGNKNTLQDQAFW